MEITLTLDEREAHRLFVALMVAKAVHAANADAGNTGAPGTALRAGHEAQAAELPALVDKLLAAWAEAARPAQ